ncbi:MAG: dihydroxyacetone kinase subunit DhaK, partial [Erysipelotrichaceae bacterium]|nr:dihydroxyacetone kinase subunit DhaK [Erysipelotrichaceae bacterium]
IVGVCDGGHMPAFAGYVGKGMLHGASVGKTLKSPSEDDIYDVIVGTEKGKGCIVIPLIWNDELRNNVENAVGKARENNIDVRIAEIRDDCMQPRNDASVRKTHAGVFFACKIAGSAAEDGRSIDEIMNLLKRVNDNVRTAADIGHSFYLPGQKTPYLQIDEDMMQVGVGLHGEPGFEMVEFPTAYLIAEHLFRHRLNKELKVQPGEEIALMVNDMGSTTLEECLIVFQEEARQFEMKGATIVKSYVGRYMTTLDLDGVAISALRLDEETKKYLLAESDAMIR